MKAFRMFYMVAGIAVLAIIFEVGKGADVTGPKIDTDYSEDEVEKLAEFHKEMDEELLEDYMKTDEYLIHFLRARNGDLDKALKLARITMKWRAEFNAADLVKESFSSLKRQNPAKMDFYDKEGRPVIMLYFGRWNLRNAIISGQRAQLVRYFDSLIEHAVAKVREIRKTKNIDINKFMWLVDMNAYSFTTHGCLNCVPLIIDFARHLETYYAAQSVRIWTINTPRLFIPVFELFKPLMSEVTVAGFRIFGPDKSEWKPELLKVISADQLPPEYGGSKSAKTEKLAAAAGRDNNEVTD